MDANMRRMNAGQAPRKAYRSVSLTDASGRPPHGAGLRQRAVGRWACLALASLLAAGGCQNSSRGRNGLARLSPRSVPYLSGVAVPSGFQMSERLTDAYESGGVRFARQEYAGYADPYAIRDFYKEQMPLLGWRETSSHDIKGKLFLRFENKHEECNVTVEPSVWFNRATIQVVVKPFSRSASEPPAKRPMP